MEKIKVIVKEPGMPAELREVKPDYQEYRKIVNGYIEAIPMPGTSTDLIYIVLNEEGKLQRLEPNLTLKEYSDILVGTLFFVGCSQNKYGERDFAGLTDKQIAEVYAFISGREFVIYDILTDKDIDDLMDVFVSNNRPEIAERLRKLLAVAK